MVRMKKLLIKKLTIIRGGTPLSQIEGLEVKGVQNVDIRKKRNFKGQTVFQIEARKINYEPSQTMMEQVRDNVKTHDNWGRSPLHEACRYGNYKMAKLLLENGADPNEKDWDDWTALHEASYYGNENIVNLLLEYCADVNCEDSVGRTPLMLSCLNGYEEIVRLLLLEKNIDCNKQERVNGNTALHFAVDIDRPRIVADLIKVGASVSVENNDGNKVENYCEKKCMKRELIYDDKSDDQYLNPIGTLEYTRGSIIKSLFVFESAKHFPDELRYLVYDWLPMSDVEQLSAVNRYIYSKKNDYDISRRAEKEKVEILFRVSKIGYQSILEDIIKSGIELNKQNERGETALYVATFYGNIRVANRLLEKDNVDVNLHCKNGRTALHETMSNMNEELAINLIKKGALANKRDWNGRTPLHEACYNGLKLVADALIKNGVDINEQDLRGRTPLMLASLNGHVELVKKLLAYDDIEINGIANNGFSALYMAVMNGHKNIVFMLIDREAEVNQETEINKYSVLHKACEIGDEDIVNRLMLSGAKVDCRDKYGRTPLMLAAKKGHNHIVKILLSNSADLFATSNCGDTSLHWATIRGNVEVLETLVTSGADVNRQNTNGETALHLAVKNCKADAAIVLLLSGASYSITNNKNKTVVDYISKKQKVRKALFEKVKINTAEVSRIENSAENICKYYQQKGRFINEDGKNLELMLTDASEISKREMIGKFDPFYEVMNVWGIRPLEIGLTKDTNVTLVT